MSDKTSDGVLRDSQGALVVVFKTDAVAPVKWRGGYLCDAAGAVVVKSKGS